MKSGFVVLVGRSNVGKSTLMNTLVGTKIAATSFRAQMTRDIIHGVMTMQAADGIEGGQAVFIDTPGVFKDRKNALTGRLQAKIQEALKEIDLIIYVVDPSKEIGPEERATFGMIRHLDIKKILVINKTDLPEREREHQAEYESWGKEFDAMLHLSALRGSHIQPLKQKVLELLPEGEAMYPEEQYTNIDNYFWISEIVREKAFSVFDKEVPYSLAVKIDNVEDKPDIMVISGRVLTNAERYKKIIIGHHAQKIREIGVMARRELEAAINKKVFLELEVEVDPHWVESV